MTVERLQLEPPPGDVIIVQRRQGAPVEGGGRGEDRVHDFERKGDALEYGLGLRPDLTGQGVGLDFFRAGLEFAHERFEPERVILAVAAFNERARIVYERAGFRIIGRHMRRFERWGEVEFIDMEER